MNNTWLMQCGYGQVLYGQALALEQLGKPCDWLNGILDIWV
jgi:hypothetical protein